MDPFISFTLVALNWPLPYFCHMPPNIPDGKQSRRAEIAFRRRGDYGAPITSRGNSELPRPTIKDNHIDKLFSTEYAFS